MGGFKSQPKTSLSMCDSAQISANIEPYYRATEERSTQTQSGNAQNHTPSVFMHLTKPEIVTTNDATIVFTF
jgi:hypothetical protein